MPPICRRLYVNIISNQQPPACCRSYIKQLTPYQGQRMKIKGQLVVKSNQEQLFKTYVDELQTMLGLLDSYLDKSAVSVAEAESLPNDCEEEDVTACKVTLTSLSAQGEHHLCGVKRAKTRFQSLAQS